MDKTSEFIKQHRHEDVRKLAFLLSKQTEIDAPFVLNQIQGWQIAQKKLPTWAAKQGMIYPPHLSLEQCSSEKTARYKQALISRLFSQQQQEKSTMADLTGGFGVDFSYMAPAFQKAFYVEKQAHLCEIAKQNFATLNLHQAEVFNKDGEDFLQSISTPLSLLYLDPARRNQHGQKTYAIEDCQPNVITLCESLRQKALWTIIKLSPLLDWHAALAQLKGVHELHIVSVKGECKELLVVIGQNECQQQQIYCVNDDQVLQTSVKSTHETPVLAKQIEGEYLYEPHASIMKAGCFAALTKQYDTAMIDVQSHLFIAHQRLKDFPGRAFHIENISSMNKKELKTKLGNCQQANITTRNFPMSTEQLRKKLKLKEGGTDYLFATTMKQKHVIIICKKTE